MRTLKTLILGLALLLTATACGPQAYSLRGTPSAAGADGKLELEKTEAGNYLLNLEVEHLAPASRIEAGKKVYVAWLVTEDKAPVKLGKLAYDGDDREGKMVATTTEQAFIFRVTAEEGLDAEKPGGTVIFEQVVEAD
ncbi:MAG: hypothetical protein KC613_09730 [Myxococcales bacterium]|nr:hypothetical protein [Myxococcales bacterium]